MTSRPPHAPRRASHIGLGLKALVLLFALAGQTSAQDPVATPPHVFAGDTHVHVQSCLAEPDLGADDVYAIQQAEELPVALVQIWGTLTPDYPLFQSLYVPLVTGDEHPLTSGDPQHALQFGVEVSGFPASQFGHVQAWGIHDAAFPLFGEGTGEALEFFGAQPDALRGYAHAIWWTDDSPVPFIPNMGAPYMAAVDAALGRIDVIEAFIVADSGLIDWRGLHDRLLTAGLRLSLAAGSDNTCGVTPVGLGGRRTYARLPSPALDIDAWLAAVAAGRTSIADGDDVFLDLAVDAVPTGGQIALPTAGTVDVHASLRITDGVPAAGTISVLWNGAPVATQAYNLPIGGATSFDVTLPVSGSGWFAAEVEQARTGAIYVVVDDRPVCDMAEAAYWSDYCAAFEDAVDVFIPGVGQAGIASEAAAARKVFDALLACASPLPSGVAELGSSTAACAGPIAIGVTGAPQAGDPGFALTCLAAPPDAPGALVLGLGADPVGYSVLGADFYIDLSRPYVLLPVQSTEGGYAELPLVLPAALEFAAQFVWLNPEGCGPAGMLSASDAMILTTP